MFQFINIILIAFYVIPVQANIFQFNQTLIETTPLKMTCLQNQKSMLLQLISVPNGQQCQVGVEIQSDPASSREFVQFRLNDQATGLRSEGEFKLFRQDQKNIFIDLKNLLGQQLETAFEFKNLQFQCLRNQNKDPLKQCLEQTQVAAQQIFYQDNQQKSMLQKMNVQIQPKSAKFQMQKLRSQQSEKTTDFNNMAIWRSTGIAQMPTDELYNIVDFFLQKIEISIGQIQTIDANVQFLKTETESLGMFEIDKIYDLYVDVTKKNFTFVGKYKTVLNPKIDVRGTIVLDRKNEQLIVTVTKSKIGVVPVTYLVPFILKRAVSSPRMKVSGSQIFISLK